jgi:hypothetical protein
MGNFINNQWFPIAIIFLGIILYVFWIRRQDHKWIEKRFSGSNILVMSFGVNFFGIASESGKLCKSSGFLLLLSDRLFYRSRMTKREFEIMGSRITGVTHGNSIRGIDLNQSVMKITFLDDEKKTDTAAFRVPYPPQWIRAIENLVKKKARQKRRS